MVKSRAIHFFKTALTFIYVIVLRNDYLLQVKHLIEDKDDRKMTIHHVNSNCSYALYETKGNFFIESGTYKAIHAKSDMHDAIWYLIDWIRMVCFTNITDQDCEILKGLIKAEVAPDKEDLMNTICGRKLNRVFYEHAYGLIFEAYENDTQQVIKLNNEVNFFIYDEIIQLLRFNPVKVKNS